MKKIRTATITFHRALNVGAVLQAYALQHALMDLDVENEILDYRNAHFEKSNSVFFRSAPGIKGIVKMIIALPFRMVRKRRFEHFINQYLHLSQPLVYSSDFETVRDAYDVYYTGSDQVWSPYHAGKVDGRYFLDFVSQSSKRKSYAASFGLTHLPEVYSQRYSNLLSNFDTISVRESSAIEIVEELIGKTSIVVLDPVYLVDESHWRSMASLPRRLPNEYLLLFCVNGLTDDLVQGSRRIAEEKSLKIVYLSNRPRRIRGIKVVSNFAPKEFLGYLLNAKYVVTDSFHAMSFSIIFEKDFSLKIASQHGNKNNRSLELMERLGITGRTLAKEEGVIDWVGVEAKLAQEKVDSLRYLKDSIGL